MSLDKLVRAETQRAETSEEPDIFIGSREQLFYLLAEASEIEHTLMCSYLYAAFSLKDERETGMSRQESQAVERWRKTIMDVAIEEMGHLLMVANLTVAIGGRPHFVRPNFPVCRGYFPSGVVLRLTPFSFDTLAHFIFLERPTGMEACDVAGFQGAEIKREQAHQGLMPSSQDYATVSHLYEAIRANLNAFAEHCGGSSLFIGPESGQIGPEMARMPAIQVIRDLESAGRVIDLIVEQGEGSPVDRQESHYQRFQAIRREYVSLLAENPSFAPTYPVAENPVMRRPPEPEDKVFITAEPAAMVLDLANAVYGMLLRLLVQTYTKSDVAVALEKELMLSAAIALMQVLNRLGKSLAKLPADLDHLGVSAGMTFTMLRGVEPFVTGAAEKTLILERLHQLASGARQVALAVPELTGVTRELADLAVRFQSTLASRLSRKQA